jgi:predicted nucleotidyltransferase
LAEAAAVRDRAERGARLAAVLTEALRPTGREPILVGGAAVEFYTQGAYTTSDIDMVTDGGKDLAQVMKDLGFEKIGKDFVDRKNKVYVEFPSSTLKASERARTVRAGNRTFRIISLEDLIVDRLNAFKFWRSLVDGANALMLLELGEADEKRLEKRAEEEKVLDTLIVLRKVREEIIRKNLPRDQADALLSKVQKLQK